MKKELAMKWVKALKSGKYKQAKGSLRSRKNDSFCCLGVACDLLVNKVAWSLNNPESKLVEFGSFKGVLPDSIQDYYGLDSIDGSFERLPKQKAIKIFNKMADKNKERFNFLFNDFQRAEYVRELSLAELNDECDFNFNEIADVIEENYKYL